MLKKLSCLSVAALLLLVHLTICAAQEQKQKRGASTPEERARAVELATRLENEPLAKDAKQMRMALLTFLAEVPDISVTFCPGVLGNTKGIKGDVGSNLVGQLIYSQAKFIIENPEQAQDDFKVYLAGVEGVLRAYKAVRQAKPKEKLDLLEDLLAKQTEGTLGEFVRAQMNKGCQNNSSN